LTSLAADKSAWWRQVGVTPIFAMFFLESFVLGNWIPRIPDVKTIFGFSASQLGLSLFVLAFGTLIAFLFGGWLLKSLGVRRACAISLPVWAMAVMFFPFMPSGYALGPLLIMSGLGIGLLEIAMNTAADLLERKSGRRFMSKAHGFWSIGSLLGALIGAGFGGLGVEVGMHFLIVMPLTAVVGIYFALKIPEFGADDTSKDSADSGAALTLPSRGLVVLCIMPLGVMMVEGAFIDWSALFIRDVLSGGVLASGLIYAAFSAVMAATRLCGDWLQDEFGVVRVAKVSCFSAFSGIVLFAVSPNLPTAFLGALLAGLGTAIVYPLAMSVAARRPGDAEDNVAAMSLFAFTSFMLAPPLLGAIADYAGLRVALLVIAPLAACSFLLCNELKKDA